MIPAKYSSVEHGLRPLLNGILFNQLYGALTMYAKDAIESCAKDPEQLRTLDPFLFESVIAELLARFGWEVSVTPQIRDGGYDVLGITTDPSGLQTSWIVECKRYSRRHKVGVEIARQLVGVKTHIGVPNAVLVTTSTFTAGVRELSAARQDLHLVDFETLALWLGDYSPPAEASYAEERTFSSCFICHSSKDEKFSQKLAANLRGAGVPVWYAPEDILPGEKIVDQVKKAIGSFDRLLVVLSGHSMTSNWVETELASALAREQTEGRRVLFPVALVGLDEIRNWECVDPDTGIDIARELRSYHISDFSDWTNSASFQEQLVKVVQALGGDRAGSSRVSRVFHLQQRMRGERIDERESAARDLGKMGRAAASAIPTLRKALKDPSMYIRNAAAWALGEIGTEEARQALQAFENR